MTLDQAIETAGDCLELAQQAGIKFIMALGVAFVCPYQGVISDNSVIDVVHKLYQKGIRRLYLAASTGMETPIHIHRVFSSIRERWPDVELGFHVHEKAGMASANMFAAILAGATSVEGSICGIGGGIAMPKGTGDIGNLRTEDIVNMLNKAEIETGLDTELMLSTAREIEGILDIQNRIEN